MLSLSDYIVTACFVCLFYEIVTDCQHCTRKARAEKQLGQVLLSAVTGHTKHELPWANGQTLSSTLVDATPTAFSAHPTIEVQATAYLPRTALSPTARLCVHPRYQTLPLFVPFFTVARRDLMSPLPVLMCMLSP
ncbi:hypothetical protein GGR57DRAFT_191834 [Xylariaceae sp. FL1272]|nr:hypothetical protein GGR57DRAFT_191834 [Xylariaceae sp. FL1272]